MSGIHANEGDRPDASHPPRPPRAPHEAAGPSPSASSVRVHFLLDDLLVEAPAGTPLQRIADAAGADITFACRSGTCGTCRVRVTAGLEACPPPGPEERDFLAWLKAPADQRLACQLVVGGEVTVEYLGP